jgi:hypothetical protein
MPTGVALADDLNLILDLAMRGLLSEADIRTSRRYGRFVPKGDLGTAVRKCRLYPRQRTSIDRFGWSVSCQKRSSRTPLLANAR